MRRTEYPFLERAKEMHWRRRYHEQAIAAYDRGILFKLTFDEWFNIWKHSGQLMNRGTKYGQYVMARNADRGPYEVGNVSIITCSQNSSDAHLGVKRTEEHKKKISIALKRSWGNGSHARSKIGGSQ